MTDRDRIIEILAYVYNSIPWAKLRLRSPHDVWNHRIRAAATRPTVAEAISRLANFFGVQSLPEEAVGLIEQIQDQNRVLDNLIREHIVYAMLAVTRAKELRKERKKQVQQQKDEQQ